MIEELKNYFKIIQSIKAYEKYSDNSRVDNETLAFTIVKKHKDNSLCEIIELIYIANKLGIRDLLISFSIKYFIKPEGAGANTMDIKHRLYLKQIKLKNLIIAIKNKIGEFNKQGKVVFFQNRVDWQAEKDKEFYYYRRRLAIHICDKDVDVLNDDILTDNEKADKRYSEMVSL